MIKSVYNIQDKTGQEKKLPFIFTVVLYMFFAVRLSPDLLNQSTIWKAMFILYTLIGFVTILIKGKIRINNIYLKWYIPFFIWAFLSRYWSYSQSNATNGLDIFIVIIVTFGILSIVVCNMVQVYQIIRIIMLALFTMMVNLVFSLQWNLLFSVRLGLDNINSNWNANDLGFKLAIFIFLSIYLAHKKQIKKSYILLLINVLSIFFIILTGSRMAIITLLLILFVYFGFERGKTVKYTIIGVIFIFMISIALMNIPFLYNFIGYRFEGLLTGQSVEGSFIGRLKMIEMGFQWFQTKPLIGFGLDNFRAISPFETYSHNTYIELFVNLGLIGFILYYSLYIFLLRKSRLIKSNKNFILSIIISGFILDIMNVSYQSFLWNMLLWLAVISYDKDINRYPTPIK